MFGLLTVKRFAPLFWTQFFSAFNDNILKNALVFLILFKMSGPDSEALVTLAGGIFILPFFFLSALGGQLADSRDKAVMAQRLKLMEIGAAGFAVLGFGLHMLPLLFVSLFLFGVIAALFGPIKYGILPDHLELAELPAANALIEGATFIAIILGTVVGAVAAQGGGSPTGFALLLMTLAGLCYASSLFIPQTGIADANLKVDANVLRSTFALLKDLRSDLRLWNMGLIVSIFWVIGVVVMSLLPSLVKNSMGGSELVVSVYLAVFAVSIAIGSGLGSVLSHGRIVLMPVPIACLVMGVFAFDFAWGTSHLTQSPVPLDVAAFFKNTVAWRIGIDLAGIAIAGGIYIVPSFSAAQHWAPAQKRSQVIAAINVQNAAGMVLATVVVGLLQKFGLSVSQLFICIGIFCGASALWIFRILPDADAGGNLRADPM